MADDLHSPLGLDKRPGRRLGRQGLLVGLSGLLIVMAMSGAWIWQRWTTGLPSGAVVARIEPAPAAPPLAPAPPPAAPKPAEDHAEVDVVRPPGTPAGTGIFIKVPQDPPSAALHALDPELVEMSRFGPLPQRGPNGARPMDVYARALVTGPGLPANAPRVALVVGGLGADGAFAAEAAIALPLDVTLGFRADGSDLEHRVQAARAAGHEIVLQLSTDGFDDHAGASASHRLTPDLAPNEVLDRLHWQMARFTGYVGASAPAGAAFTAAAAAVRPVLSDLARRGLFFVDDGASSQSAVPSLASTLDLPLVRTDVVLDGEGGFIDASLGKLEQRARDRGYAVGLVSAAPASIGRVALFAQKLSDRGVALVPLSTIAGMQAGRPAARATP